MRQHIKYGILCLGFAISLQAQNPHPAWRNYSTEDGLPSPEVHCILQDSEGFMWFGTDIGVSQFDGYTFRNYGPKEGLLDNMVLHLFEDGKGRIWMNTIGGNIYYFDRDSIHAYAFNDTIQQFRKRYNVAKQLYVDDQSGTVYTCLRGLGILIIEENGNYQLLHNEFPYSKVIILEPNGYFLYSYSNPSPQFLEDSLPKIKKSYYNTIDLEFHLEDQSIKVVEVPIDNPGRGVNGTMARLEKGDYLVQLQSRNLQLINNYTYAGVLKEKKGFAFVDAIKVEDGKIFICDNYKGGLRMYSSLNTILGNQFDLILPDVSVSSVFQDNQGNMWVGTTEKGLFFTPCIDLWIYDQSSGILNPDVNGIAIRGDRDIFAGMRYGEVYHLDVPKSSLQLLPTQAKEVYLYDLFYDRETKLLYSGSTILNSYSNKQWKPVPLYDNVSPEPYFRTIKRLTKKYPGSPIWGSGMTGSSQITQISNAPPSRFDITTADSRTYVTFQDRSGNVWVGKANGLFELRNQQLVLASISHPAFSVHVEDIDELPDSTLVIGTKGQGIALWKGEKILQLTTANGLTSDVIEDLDVDDRGNIWAGTLNGLNKIYLENNNFRVKTFKVHHGLPTNEINKVKTDGKEVWVGTTKGLVHFRDDFYINTLSPSPIIDEVLVNDSTFSLDEISVKNSPIPRFSHFQNNFILKYKTLNYKLDGQIPFRYRLHPIQNKWVNTSAQIAYFFALRDNKYLFEVQSQNEDSIWSESTIFRFNIKPPFWKTWWFFTLVTLTLGWIAYRLYKYRTGQIRHEAEVVKQMAELERSALRAQMNPHFIFNCLNSISNFINKGDKVAANQYLATFAKLIRGTLHQSIANTINLEDEISLLENYMKLEQMRFEQRFDYHIELADNIVPFEIEIPPMMAQPFIENAIIHGLSRKEEKGKIDLRYERENGYLKISIIDNGIGIEQSKKQKSGEKSLHKSVGMTITKKRLDMLSGKGYQGRFETEELKNAAGKVEGTKVQVWIPLMMPSSK